MRSRCKTRRMQLGLECPGRRARRRRAGSPADAWTSAAASAAASPGRSPAATSRRASPSTRRTRSRRSNPRTPGPGSRRRCSGRHSRRTARSRFCPGWRRWRRARRVPAGRQRVQQQIVPWPTTAVSLITAHALSVNIAIFGTPFAAYWAPLLVLRSPSPTSSRYVSFQPAAAALTRLSLVSVSARWRDQESGFDAVFLVSAIHHRVNEDHTHALRQAALERGELQRVLRPFSSPISSCGVQISGQL